MARDGLIQKILKQEIPGGKGPLPVLSLEDFFEGNHDQGSIGCNLSNHPGIERFYEVLRAIRARDEVQDVLVEIYDLNGLDEEEEDGDESDEDLWVFSERVYIITSAAPEQIADWMKELQPDDFGEGWAFGKPPAAPGPNAGLRVFSVWWD